MRAVISVVVAIGCVVAVSSAQSPQSAGGRTTPNVRIRLFTQTSDGDWRTVVQGPDGRHIEWTYVPPTKFTASVDTSLTVIEPSEARIRYEYRVNNAATSQQQVAFLHIGPGMPPATIRRAPPGWERFVETGWAMLFGPGHPPSGIVPGSTDVVELEARNLPGVVAIAAQGNVGVPEIPGELSEQQERELDQLSKVSAVELQGIGPTIPAGISEPDLSMRTLIVRVGAHYAEHLNTARHPHAADLVKTLERAAQKEGALSNVRNELLQVQAIAKKPIANPWHQDLSDGLGVCVDLLLGGHVPTR